MSAFTRLGFGSTILGLDIGTTSAKGVLFDLEGAELAVEERAYGRRVSPAGRAGGLDWAEQDPDEVWHALVGVVRTIVERVGDRTRIQAMTLAAQSGSLLPARADGSPVYPIITWMDGRAESLVNAWRAECVEVTVRRISGWHLYPGLCLATIAWLKEHQPEVYAAARRYLSVNDYLVYRLTGRFCTNPSNASGMQLVDITTGDWSPELCDLAGIEPGQLSPILPSGAAVGPLTPEASCLTGLPAGTVVVNGGHDQGCTALALGLRSPGEILLACGTAWVITSLTGSPDVSVLPPGLDLNFLPASRSWTVSQSLGGLGASLEWLLQHCWSGTGPAPTGIASTTDARASAFAALDAELMETTPGVHGLLFLPTTGGHRAPAGDQRGGFWGLRLDHSRADLARAVMEGAAYELRWALEPIRQDSMPIERMWMIGGATRSPLWPAIVANVVGLRLALPESRHLPAIGAAILAGVGAGAFETVEQGQAIFHRPARHIEPDRTTMQSYDGWFADYRRVACLSATPTKD